MNETTLIVGGIGSGKTTLAQLALKYSRRAVIITAFGDEFGCVKTANVAELAKHERVCFTSDDDVLNDIAMRFAYEKGNLLLIVDEAHLFFESGELQKVIRYSRHKKLDVVLLSHCFFDVDRVNRMQMHNILVFRIGEPYELGYIERFAGKSRRETVVQLPPYYFCVIKGVLPQWLASAPLAGETHHADVYKVLK